MSNTRTQDYPTGWKVGFTLIELLVVIAIIGMLASMLLPTLSRAIDKSKLTQCVNNLRQIGMGLAMYTHDQSDRFPPPYFSDDKGHVYKAFQEIGGRDPRQDVRSSLSPAALRPLYPYLKTSEVFHCPDDHGFSVWACDRPRVLFKPSCWEIVGCSYSYNDSTCFGRHDKTRFREDGILAGNKVGWVPNPTRFISMFEPPAKSFPIDVNGPTHVFQHWHYSPPSSSQGIPNPVDWPQPDLPRDGAKYISPVLFVDSHVAVHDFTRVIKSNPDYIYEETKDWIWYKPLRDQANVGSPVVNTQ